MFISLLTSSKAEGLKVVPVMDSRQTLEAPPAAAEERIPNGLACTSILAGAGHACRDLHVTVGSGELGRTAAAKS